MTRHSPIRFRVVAPEDGTMLANLVARRLRLEQTDRAREMVKAGGVYLGRHRVRIPTVRVQTGERVTVYPEAADIPRLPPDALVFAHRDEDFVVLDKPPGVPVAATRQAARGTLTDALIAKLAQEGVERPYVGVIHRLDADASGLVLMTTRSAVNKSVHQQFENHRIERTYRLLVHGEPPSAVTCDAPLDTRRRTVSVAPAGAPDARAATTHFRRLDAEATSGTALLEATLETGRTHQIRVHAAHLGFPIVGDTRYGGPEADRLHLHAATLAFDHPVTGQAVRVVSTLPEFARTPTDGPTAP